MKNFIDFTVEVAGNRALGEEFRAQMGSGDHSQLSAWFQSKGYGINPDEAKKLCTNLASTNTALVGLMY